MGRVGRGQGLLRYDASTVHVSYSVEWKATVSMSRKKNKRTLATDTERDITFELVAYILEILLVPQAQEATQEEGFLRRQYLYYKQHVSV